MRFSIDQKILETVLNFMATRPYKEVAGLMADVQKDVKVIQDKEHPHQENISQNTI